MESQTLTESEPRIPFTQNARYELRGEKVQCRNGSSRIVWRAYRIGGVVTPHPVHEIMKSADPNLVAADLSDWLEGKRP